MLEMTIPFSVFITFARSILYRMTKKKLVLVNPRGKHQMGFVMDIESRYPPLGLGIIAALTPDNWEVVLKDENFDEFEFEDADLVGITSFTSTITRAYDIATIYKNKNIPVIMGGIHASMLPDEAGEYADSVAIGEVESIWKEILADFGKGQLKKRYYGIQLTLDQIPMVQHDIFHKDYVFDSIQTTRGCPMACDFCSVQVFNGRAYRTRPVEDVLDEIETITKSGFIFIDDNIVGYNKPARDHAKAIFRGMIERGIKKDWFCQASINFGDDEELLALAAESGCRMVGIGVESEKTEALQSMNKKANLKTGVDNYQKVFSVIHSYGIGILGTFILALDTDTLEDLNDRVEYIINSNIDAAQISTLTPFPGTVTYKQYEAEGRIIANNYPKDWEKYWGGDIVIEPMKITSEELRKFHGEAMKKLYNFKRLMRMLRTTLKATKNAKAAVWAFLVNTHYHNMEYLDDESKQIKFKDFVGDLVDY